MTICCRTSADLFKTVFDLLVSVTVFVGRFDMRMMQVGYLELHILLQIYSFYLFALYICGICQSHLSQHPI